jgi:hypothetical protein
LGSTEMPRVESCEFLDVTLGEVEPALSLCSP